MQSAFPQKNVLSSATIFNRSRGNGACRGNREFGNEMCGNVARDIKCLRPFRACEFSIQFVGRRFALPYAIARRAVGAFKNFCGNDIAVKFLFLKIVKSIFCGNGICSFDNENYFANIGKMFKFSLRGNASRSFRFLKIVKSSPNGALSNSVGQSEATPYVCNKTKP